MRPEQDRAPAVRRRPEIFFFALFLALSLSLLLISTRSFVVNVQEVGMSVFSGVRSGIFSVGDFGRKTVGAVRELSNLREEYADLTRRLEQYEIVQRDSADIRRENQRLRELLSFSETISYKHFPARIIGRDPDNLYSAFVIDKGSRHGIKKNLPVIAYQDGIQGLVGKVVQVGRSESLVMPVYDSRAFVSARFSESRYEGIVAGQGDADHPLLMKYIKKRAKEEIHFGDTIATSGMGGIYPTDIVIGRVSRLIFQEYETSLSVEIDPAIDFSRLEYVFCVEKDEVPRD